MTNDALDERYSVAEDAIRDAFFLLLNEKEPEKISVSDVIKKAGIVRSTFYNHYENMPELINSIEDKTVQEIFSLMEVFHPRNNTDICKSYFLSICEYIKKNPFLATLLKSPRGDAFLGKAMNMFHLYVAEVMDNVTPSKYSKDEVSYMVACTIGASLGVLHKWTADNFSTPEDKVADILTNAFTSGMLPYIT